MARQLDIAIVVEHLNPYGGQERVAYELARRWAGRHRVTIYCYRAEAADLDGVDIVRVRPELRHVAASAVLFPLLVSRQVRRGHDVVLSQGGNCLVQNFALFHTCHRTRLELLRRIVEERGWPLSARERITAAIRRLWFLRLERRALLRCRGSAFAVSAGLKAELCRAHGVPPSEVGVAHNGVDTSAFNPAVRSKRATVRERLGLGQAAPVAIFVGGRWTEKGVAVAIRAVAACKRWHLLVVGADDQEARFRELAQRLGASGRVHFLGHRRDVPELYGAADCLVYPSLHEPFGLAVIEAAACGLPVLISETVYAREVLEGDGCFVLPREPEAFAAVLRKLEASPQWARQLGDRIAQRAARCTWDRQAEILERAFIEWVEQRRRKGR